MPTIKEGQLSFHFDFDAIKLDDCHYYRKHFIKIKNDIKAIDILAVDSEIGYLIEVKDYRHPETENLELKDLIKAIIDKVLCTLSMMLPMKNNAYKLSEREIANQFSGVSRIRVVLHIETPPRRRTLNASKWNPQTIQMQLKRRLSSIDPHPKVVSKDNLKALPWTVTKASLSL